MEKLRPGRLIALAGNPNSGKTSLFNSLTGANQNVGNYPGVTVERREGRLELQGETFRVVDLPGSYSLTSFTIEEKIAQQELLERSPDIVVVVVDSTTLSRSLVFLAQVMHLPVNLVLCLNMSDEAARSGQRLDLDLLERLLGFPVVETAAHRGIGVDRLREGLQRSLSAPRQAGDRLVLGQDLETAINKVAAGLEGLVSPGLQVWTALKLLLGEPIPLELDPDLRGRVEAAAASARKELESLTGQDISLHVTEQYHGFAAGLLREVTRGRARKNARQISDMIDNVLVHRVLGLPIFLGVMYSLFWLTFSVGEYPMNLIEAGFALLGRLLAESWPQGWPELLRSLLEDGLIGGVGGVIVFLPNIILLFAGLALLEDSGYMARAAFLMDRVMHRFGLHGKSFVPMMLGMGCSIPGIMATRTLDNERDRLTTMLVLPLVPCGARFPIWMLLVPAFFPPAWRAPVLWGIYLLGMVLALVVALVLRKTLLEGDDAPFVMELPPYRMPTAKAAVRKIRLRSWLYLRKAGTVILGISLLLWTLTTFPRPEHYRVDYQVARGAVLTDAEIETARANEDLEASAAGMLGRLLEPAIAPLGFDWRIGTALIGAFAAKEVFVAQLGIVFSIQAEEGEDRDLRETLAARYSPAVGVAMILFLLIGTPCMATVAITRRESGSWKWAALQFLLLTVLAWLLAMIAYQFLNLIL